MKISYCRIAGAGLLLMSVLQGQTLPAQTGKTSVMDKRWQEGGAFAGYSPQDEVLERRTKYAKHFRNPDGTFTVQTGKVYHYKDAQGALQDIDLKLVPINKQGYAWANESNDIKTYYPATPGKGVEMKLNDKVTFRWWQSPQMTSYTTITTLDKTTASPVALGEKLTYPMVQDGVSEEFVTLVNGVENNTIVHSLTPAIAGSAAGSCLSFTQFIPLEHGWTIDAKGILQTSDFTADEFHISIPGTDAGIFFSPIIAFDHTLTQQEALYAQFAPENKLTAAEKSQKANNLIQCKYRISFVSGGVRVTTLMPADWLKQAGRSFPVTIDPTVTITPSNLVSGGSFYGPMSHWYGYQRHADIYLASEIGVSNVSISAIEYQRMTTTGTNAVAPAKVFMRTTTASTVSGTNAWNSATYTGGLTALYNASADFHGTTTGWKMITLTTPFTYTSDNLMVMVYDAYGSSGSAKYLDMSTSFTSARQAYFRQDNTDPGDATATSTESRLIEIRMTYTVAGPPSCLASPIAPANNATGICSGPVTLRWNSVSGATGYDVYFNSGSTATTVVSTNQTDTFYNATSTLGANAWKIVPKNTSGAATGCNTFNFTTITGTTATATIAVSPNDTLCPHVLATFTATNTDGGTNPAYQWKKNNVNVGGNSPTYADLNLNNNDVVKVVMTSNSTACLTSTTATSNSITMTILPTPSMTITASGPTKFCRGGSVALSVAPGAVSYQWRNISGNISGATSNTYVAQYTDIYTVVAGTSGNCTITSDTFGVTAYQLPYPHLFVSGNTLSTEPYFAMFQWYKDGLAVTGATTNTYTYSGDGSYYVAVIDTNNCNGSSFVLPINTTGVNNVVNSGYSIYPNPASGLVKINAPSGVNISVRSIDGKVVMAKNNVQEFDISPLANGMYMLYMTNEKGMLVGLQKLVKQGD